MRFRSALRAAWPMLAVAPAALLAQAPDAPTPAQAFADNCAACHQADGKGIAGAFPALAGNGFVTGPAEKPIAVVLNGRAGMPTFRDDLTDAQIAAALSYARSAWGNHAPPVTPDMVKAARAGAAVAAKAPLQAH
ncbi:c-type cytochrome [Sphingomonas morindae]|uniref:Cytochrome c n=1 Tax=Sphingomonas morindae TaxID=1541170 RepID=A0ABY4XAF9_9SPHN|nr:cytochrome c [Sphingomonas morindae]USI73860.1 cytochrome c [Sphingomonas morindae]